MARFTEEDVMAAKPISDACRLKVIVNKVVKVIKKSSCSADVSGSFINFPVKNGVEASLLKMSSGSWWTYFKIGLGTKNDFDFMGFCPVPDSLKGRKISFELETPLKESPDVKGLLKWSDEPLGLENVYEEPLRPLFHFTARRGWLNDPNGCIWHDGKYHLFFQHNPMSVEWGNMSWGHAVSPDLVHWKEMPLAMLPDESGTMFSGTAVLDSSNSSGLGTASNPPLTFFYTACGDWAVEKKPATQCLAFSLDAGGSLKKYKGNPIIPSIAKETRDPKVLWHEDSKSWVMVLYIGPASPCRHDGLMTRTSQKYAIFRSSNLKEWTKASSLIIPCNGECPDLFPLSLDGRGGCVKWVFWTADGQYLVGSFDGFTFTPEQDIACLYMGGREKGSAYAAQTFSGIQKSDARTIQVPWLQGSKFPDMPFNEQMGVPVELGLISTVAGMRLAARPVMEMERLHAGRRSWSGMPLDRIPFDGINSDGMHVKMVVDLSEDAAFTLDFHGRELVFDVPSRQIRLGNWIAPDALKPGIQDIEILVDRGSIELFAKGGLIYMPMHSLRRQDGVSVKLSSGHAAVKDMDVFEMSSVWE